MTHSKRTTTTEKYTNKIYRQNRTATWWLKCHNITDTHTQTEAHAFDYSSVYRFKWIQLLNIKWRNVNSIFNRINQIEFLFWKFQKSRIKESSSLIDLQFYILMFLFSWFSSSTNLIATKIKWAIPS